MRDTNHHREQGWLLEHLTWLEAERVLVRNPVVVMPLGASAKEHGPHLPLNNDALIAQWLAEQVRARLPVVIAPLINASHYPAFTDYPGSISLRVETACNMVVDTCRSLARHGPQRFYVLNTGISTEAPLARAASVLADERIQLDFLRLNEAHQKLDMAHFDQQHGTHADELETSLMLHIAPQVVNMDRACDDGAEGQGYLHRERGRGVWSASGVYGQATLASAQKGRLVANALIDTATDDIRTLMTERN